MMPTLKSKWFFGGALRLESWTDWFDWSFGVGAQVYTKRNDGIRGLALYVELGPWCVEAQHVRRA